MKFYVWSSVDELGDATQFDTGNSLISVLKFGQIDVSGEWFWLTECLVDTHVITDNDDHDDIHTHDPRTMVSGCRDGWGAPLACRGPIAHATATYSSVRALQVGQKDAPVSRCFPSRRLRPVIGVQNEKCSLFTQHGASYHGIDGSQDDDKRWVYIYFYFQ